MTRKITEIDAGYRKIAQIHVSMPVSVRRAISESLAGGQRCMMRFFAYPGIRSSVQSALCGKLLRLLLDFSVAPLSSVRIRRTSGVRKSTKRQLFSKRGVQQANAQSCTSRSAANNREDIVSENLIKEKMPTLH